MASQFNCKIPFTSLMFSMSLFKLNKPHNQIAQKEIGWFTKTCKFQCRHCEKIYESRHDATICCSDIDKLSKFKYECLLCEQHHTSKSKAELCCCEPIELNQEAHNGQSI